jgi:hypothetical protein
MRKETTQRSGYFWKYNIYDHFTGAIIKTDNGFKSQKEARKARSEELARMRAAKPVTSNPAKDKTRAFYYGRMNFGKGLNFK